MCLLVACGTDSVSSSECPFWESRTLEAPIESCWVDYANAWELVDADVLDTRPGQALVGPIKLRRNHESSDLTPMVLAIDTDGSCIVLDCVE